jgi:hypothetical protein
MKFILIAATFIGINAFASQSKVHFISPVDKSTVAVTFPVEFSIEGLTVEKAGILKEGTGHHHLIIDGKPIEKGQVVPKDETHKHFGDGSSKTTLTLAPGKHTLTLQFADGVHKSFGSEYSETISVNVK